MSTAAGPIGVWVVVPTYNERENVAPLVRRVLAACPRARLLVVDDGSPDGTGQIADGLAAEDARVRVLHRDRKEGLGAAYRAGFRVALDAGAAVVVQMDCDFSHEPERLPALLRAVDGGADLVLGSRYVAGGSTVGWSLLRRLVSRSGSLAARVALRLPQRDLTGGFKAWRADLLERIRFEEVGAAGYGFQIEMTWRAARAGASVAEVPIVFRERVAGRSKMTGGIVLEALAMLVKLRAEAWRPGLQTPAPAPALDPDGR